METINKPYIKQYDEQGKLLPLENGRYIHKFPNRKERRSIYKNKSFTGNHKGISLTVSQNFKYERVLQDVVNKFGKVIKTIKHYISR